MATRWLTSLLTVVLTIFLSGIPCRAQLTTDAPAHDCCDETTQDPSRTGADGCQTRCTALASDLLVKAGEPATDAAAQPLVVIAEKPIDGNAHGPAAAMPSAPPGVTHLYLQHSSLLI